MGPQGSTEPPCARKRPPLHIVLDTYSPANYNKPGPEKGRHHSMLGVRGTTRQKGQGRGRVRRATACADVRQW